MRSSPAGPTAPSTRSSAPADFDPHAYLERLHFFKIKPGLDRIRHLLAALGNPERAYPAVHIAGTNGKGSVAAFLSSIARCAGYRVGTYTSPHLSRVTERMTVSGDEMPDDALADLCATVRDAAASLGEEPTYFEVTTAMAFLHFARPQVDIAVIETGMGGKWDATNVLSPLVTIITPLSFDHTERLGTTLGAIMSEKAGILRAGTPVVTVPHPEQAACVLEAEVDRVNARRVQLGVDFRIAADKYPRFDYHGMRQSFCNLTSSLAGRHQVDNAALALAAAELLTDAGFAFAEEAVRTGLAETRWPGRCETVPGHPPLLLDGAHNPGGARVLRAFIAQQWRPEPPGALRRYVLVCGMVRTKDMEAFWRELAPRVDERAPVLDAVVLVPVSAAPSHDLDELARVVRVVVGHSGREIVVEQADDVPAALAAARRRAGSDGGVVVTGSLYLVGAVRDALGLS